MELYAGDAERGESALGGTLRSQVCHSNLDRYMRTNRMFPPVCSGILSSTLS